MTEERIVTYMNLRQAIVYANFKLCTLIQVQC